MNANQIHKRVSAAKEICVEAGALIRKEIVKGLLVEQKGRNDIVTNVDETVERFITKTIRERFPADNIFGEELGGALLAEGCCWIIDPIDGTENFSRGIPEYAISIGFTDEQGKPVLGAVYAPALNELFWASRKQGAYLNGQPIQASMQNDPGKAVTAIAPPFRRHDRAEQYFQYVKTLFFHSCDIRNQGSAALHGCYVACGRLEGYVENHVMPYDIAAMLVIAEEAGAQYASLFQKDKHPFESQEILCANNALFTWYDQLSGNF